MIEDMSTPIGRPPSLDPQRSDAVVAAFRAGLPVRTAAALAGIHRSTLRRWLARGALGRPPYAALSVAVETARLAAATEDFEAMRTAASA